MRKSFRKFRLGLVEQQIIAPGTKRTKILFTLLGEGCRPTISILGNRLARKNDWLVSRRRAELFPLWTRLGLRRSSRCLVASSTTPASAPAAAITVIA